MASVRKATLKDVAALVALGAVMHAESPRFSRHPYMPERATATLQYLLGEETGCVFVAERDGSIVGMFVGVVVQHFACDFKEAGDLALFVHPDYRGGTAAARLVREYVNWAEAMGAEPSIGINTGVHPERTGDLLSALGGEQSGTTYTWGI